MADDLKPCPFCGGSATLHPHVIGRRATLHARVVVCYGCSAAVTGGSKADAISHWNRRVAALAQGDDEDFHPATSAHDVIWIGQRKYVAEDAAPEPGEAERLRAENERLREALRFYRDEWEDDADQEWISPTHSVGSIGTEPTDALREDKGRRARAALARGYAK